MSGDQYLYQSLITEGKYDEALKIINERIEIEPENDDLYIDRAYIFSHRREWESAEADLNTARDITCSTDVLEGLGDLFLQKNQYNDAIQAYSRAIESEGVPHFIRDVYMKRAFAYMATNSAIEAKNDILTFIEIIHNEQEMGYREWKEEYFQTYFNFLNVAAEELGTDSDGEYIIEAKNAYQALLNELFGGK